MKRVIHSVGGEYFIQGEIECYEDWIFGDDEKIPLMKEMVRSTVATPNQKIKTVHYKNKVMDTVIRWIRDVVQNPAIQCEKVWIKKANEVDESTEVDNDTITKFLIEECIGEKIEEIKVIAVFKKEARIQFGFDFKKKQGTYYFSDIERPYKNMNTSGKTYWVDEWYRTVKDLAQILIFDRQIEKETTEED